MEICMIKYTKGFVNILSFIISIIIFLILNNFIFLPKIDSNKFLSNQFQEKIETNNLKQEKTQAKDTRNTSTKKAQTNKNTNLQNNKSTSNTKKEQKVDYKWCVEIPKINLKAPISEGTTKEIMDSYVGHFTDTQRENGNIGLAAHNRGYKVNYFQDLKKLKEGDEIIYKYNNFKKTYVIRTIKIIKDTDWTYLEKTKENKITLITCVENEPEYRRCIQGIEK